jgi:hypothetical protein
MGLTVFQNSNGKNAIIYFARTATTCLQSPPLEFDILEQGVIAGTSIGGYLQIVNSPTIATNSGTAVFQNIKIGPPDQDFDGVPDSVDACPNTPPCSIVGASGCSIEQLAPCEGPASGGTWKNHGQYVSSVAHAVNEFVSRGLSTSPRLRNRVSGSSIQLRLQKVKVQTGPNSGARKNSCFPRSASRVGRAGSWRTRPHCCSGVKEASAPLLHVRWNYSLRRADFVKASSACPTYRVGDRLHAASAQHAGQQRPRASGQIGPIKDAVIEAGLAWEREHDVCRRSGSQ